MFFPTRIPSLMLTPEITVMERLRQNHENGIYEAKIAVYLPHYQGMLPLKLSVSFFPDKWSPSQYMEEIIHSFRNLIHKSELF